MGKVHPLGQRIMAEGSVVDREAARDDILERAQQFNAKWRGFSQWERETALMRLVERVARGQESMEVLQQIVKSGMWLLELQGLERRGRWIKELRGGAR